MSENIISQYLLFSLDKEKYGLSVASVREVLEYREITRIPRMPDYMKGVINIRGSVVPVVDLRLKFGLGHKDIDVDTSIIVTELKKDDTFIPMGLLTDSVEQVIDIEEASIEAAPTIGSRVDTEFISGMGKVGDEFIILLNLMRILDDQELEVVASQASDVEKENSVGV